MGGGAGVSIPGTFRVATDKTVMISYATYFFIFIFLVLMRTLIEYNSFHSHTALQTFATPETLIGFHPDAGASFHLSHLPGYLGVLKLLFWAFKIYHFLESCMDKRSG